MKNVLEIMKKAMELSSVNSQMKQLAAYRAELEKELNAEYERLRDMCSGGKTVEQLLKEESRWHG